MLRNNSLLVLILAICIVTLRFSTVPGKEMVVFSEMPRATAVWEFADRDYHIGDVIEVTLVITTQQGTTLNLEPLAEVGDRLRLPPKQEITQPTDPFSAGETAIYRSLPLAIPEGELEIVSRSIGGHETNGLDITEIDFGLMYLQPIDLTEPFDGKFMPRLIFSQTVLTRATNGNIYLRTGIIMTAPAEFRIVPRVDENSQPIFGFFSLTPVASLWPTVRLGGFLVIGLAICLGFWRIVRLVIARRREQLSTLVIPKAEELYDLWTERQDEETFIHAIKLYRKGAWGRTKRYTMLKTTFIIYSGVNLSQHQMKNVFSSIVKEVAGEHSV